MARRNTVSHGLPQNPVQKLAIYRQRQNPILEKFYVKTLWESSFVKTLWESSFLRSFGYVPRIPTVFVRYRTEFTQLIEKEGHSIFNPRPWRRFDYAVLGKDPT